MSKGYFTIAQGEMYQRFAYALALSLKITQPKELSNLSIAITPEERAAIPSKYLEVFDQVLDIPWGDHAVDSAWKLENEWKAIHITPYDETIKLDADMLFTSDVRGRWDALSSQSLLCATRPVTYRGEVITSDYYRKVFTANELPNVYSAFMYFKKDDTSFEFFNLAEDIFKNYQRYFYEFLEAEHRPTEVSTDVVFGLAAKITQTGFSNVDTLLDATSFIHMKSKLQNWQSVNYLDSDWMDMVPCHFPSLKDMKIGQYRLDVPFHYYQKNFLTDDMILDMERELGI